VSRAAAQNRFVTTFENNNGQADSRNFHQSENCARDRTRNTRTATLKFAAAFPLAPYSIHYQETSVGKGREPQRP